MSLISTSQITIVDLDDGRTQYTHLAWCNFTANVSGQGDNAYNAFTKDPEEGRILTHIGIYQDSISQVVTVLKIIIGLTGMVLMVLTVLRVSLVLMAVHRMSTSLMLIA